MEKIINKLKEAHDNFPAIGFDDEFVRGFDKAFQMSIFIVEQLSKSEPTSAASPDTVEPTAKEGEQPWELQIIKNIWRRAYLDSEEDHVKILKEYGEKIASQERSKVIQEIEESILEEIHVIKNPTEYDYRQVEDARTIVNTTKKIIEKLNQK